ncbi:MAG: hypothetical protein GXP24_09910 [Planctomycetes bacterium]|nr:hypothetical protein [Planctomycetota bacterium]
MEEPQSDSVLSDDHSQKTAESLRILRDQADQTLGEHRQRVSEIEIQLNEQLELISDELSRERLTEEQTLATSVEQTALLDDVRQTLAEKEAEVEEVLEQLASQSLEFEAQLTERDEELEQVLELVEEEGRIKASVEQELETVRQALGKLRAQDDVESDQARHELIEIEQQLQQLQEEFQSLQEQHAAQQTELDETRQTLESALEKNEQTAATLLEAEQRVEELSQRQLESEQNEEQLEQFRRKFELALADVHKLKRENAELHEELLSRPEADDQESPELVSLRAERDALAERVSELENAPAPEQPVDGQQELEDLQRRFELAVDDVRQFKQENADLRQELETAQQTQATAATTSSDEPQDWEAQRARLMATLDAEDQGIIDEQRREELATIEGTISITDRVVAKKDTLLAKSKAEVADLQSQLESRPVGENVDELREQIAAEILGNDEAVQAECAKLKQQQEQLEDKLREAELEISVQRATLAREQAALEEKLAELPDEDSESEKTSSGKPRRRWLSALGLKDEDTEES